jgi:integrase
LVPLVGYLRQVGCLGDACPVEVTDPVEVRLFLARQRGLVAGTVAAYVRVARAFVLERSGQRDVDLVGPAAAEVTDFATRACSSLGLSATRGTISALRCLLRYLAFEGLADTAVDQAVLSVAGGGIPLPRGIDRGAVRAILASFDRRTAIGRRDYAILMFLSRLGVRGGEVVALGLGDIDWRNGEIVVSGNGGHRDRLPRPGGQRPRIQAALGHDSATVTVDNYGHLWPSDEDRAGTGDSESESGDRWTLFPPAVSAV